MGLSLIHRINKRPSAQSTATAPKSSPEFSVSYLHKTTFLFLIRHRAALTCIRPSHSSRAFAEPLKSSGKAAAASV